MATYELTVNGRTQAVSADPGTPLLWVLRDDVKMTGTKYGCGIAACGACTVHVGGIAMRSCIVPVSSIGDRPIVTIEGMNQDPIGRAVQDAWVAHDVVQCGSCQSGQIMSAVALLKSNPKPTDKNIEDSMGGNICRCGIYVRIREAIDELAARAKTDPIAYRRKLLRPDARKLRAALDLMEEKSAPWRRKLSRTHAVGIACHESFETAVACAVDVSTENNRPRIHRATVAVDTGLVVNPLTIESQCQGGLTFGLSQLMANGAVTLKNGRVEQRNFDAYTPPYIKDAPIAVDVHIVPSTEKPTGCGEPPVPVISPAVVNALAQLTGKRYRSLPLVTM